MSTPASYDAEFFLDTVCPWCWITSRWVTNVQSERDVSVGWRFISLKILNEGNSGEYVEQHREGHLASMRNLRVLHAVREAEGNDAVGRLYTELGTAIHVQQRHGDLLGDQQALLTDGLRAAGLDTVYAGHADDDSRDAALREETELALERTGRDVGTPIITFRPGTDQARSLFGPVMPRAPKGDEAVALWDAIVTVADSNVAELKRTLRGEIVFD